METWPYTDELRAQLVRRQRRRIDHDRDVARLLAPWRRHRGGPDDAMIRD